MSPAAVARLVGRLFSASARDWGQTHLEVYSEALENVSDEVGELAGNELALFVDWNNPPSIKMVKEKVNAIIARGDTGIPALVEETNPVVADAAARKAGLEEAMAALRRHQRLPSGEAHPHMPDTPDKPKIKTDAHSMGDHQFCLSDCPDRPQEVPAEPASDEPKADEPEAGE